ncbi:MAG: YiiD C-terminal domain-containing protein [Pseudomonadales bacterium]|nr:YiiD C-terminal domain-containing protein [Pseudomonadales bacterium]
MTNSDDLCRELQSLWHQNFPLSKAMGLTVVSFTDHILTTRAPLLPNTNIHNTAFAGSLYAIEAMTAWGLLYLEIANAGLHASIIHAHGDIDFAKTVNEDIVAMADFSTLTNHIDELAERGKTRLTIAAKVQTKDGVASQFSGDYLARLERTDQ